MGIAFFAVSAYVYTHDTAQFLYYRVARATICYAYLLFILLVHGNRANPLIVLFLFFYGTSSLATIWYEINIVASIAMGLNFVSFLFLIKATFPKINLKKMSTALLISCGVMILINGYLLYLLLGMIKGMTLSDVHFLLTILNSMSLFMAAFFAFLYYHTYSTRPSLIFMLAVFLIAFCEVFRAIAYYDIAYGTAAVYIARALLILGLSFMTIYTFTRKSEVEALNRTLV